MSKPKSSATECDEVGERIKLVRKNQALTLVELSERSGVSRAALSKIERGEISPTYTTLRKIALGLDQTIAGLISLTPLETKTDIEIVRADENKPFDAKDDAYRLLAGRESTHSTRCFIKDVHFQSVPGAGELHTHNTEEIIFVLTGSIVCHFEGRAPIQLNEGDSAFYRGTTPHAFTRAPANEGQSGSDQAPTALWISTPMDIVG